MISVTGKFEDKNQEVMKSKKSLKLNIGAGVSYIPNFINIDIAPWADKVIDLNKDRLPSLFPLEL